MFKPFMYASVLNAESSLLICSYCCHMVLQDRIASLNGRTVQLVIRQDKPGFIRLIGISVLQSAASAVLAPSLRQVADALAMTWRRRLTTAAHARYFKGNTFYTTSQLAGLAAVLAVLVLCCAGMGCGVLCCAVLGWAVLCMAALCMPCYVMLCYAMPCHAMPCHAMPCHAMPCYAVMVLALPQPATTTTCPKYYLLSSLSPCKAHVVRVFACDVQGCRMWTRG